MRPRSSSLLMRRCAIALVWSGVSRCLVSATSLPLIRARNTSPALMCRSDAPRSTAALMIFSTDMLAPRPWWLAACGRRRHRQETHAIAYAGQCLPRDGPRALGAGHEDLVNPLRVRLELAGALPDRREVRDHVIGQHPLALDAAPLGAAAVVRD